MYEDERGKHSGRKLDREERGSSSGNMDKSTEQNSIRDRNETRERKSPSNRRKNRSGKECKSMQNKDRSNKINRKSKKKTLKDEVNERNGSNVGNKLQNRSAYGNPNWYFSDPKLADMANSYSFQSFIGNGELIGNATMPSITVMTLNPAVNDISGYGDVSTRGVNLAAKRLYNMLANQSGRTQSYGPNDVITILLAVGEIISMTSYIKRIFGLVYTSGLRNRDFPEHIINALGVNYTDLVKNISNYRTRFNSLIQSANKIPFPGNIPWFAKCAALYETIYMDSNDSMAGIYAFVPGTTWTLDESTYSGGTVLRTTSVVMNKSTEVKQVQTMDAILNIYSTMINALLTSTSLNLIYGDILNYCSKFNVDLYHLNIVDEFYSVVPIFDEEVLLHINNSTFTGIPKSSTGDPSTLSYYTATPYNDVFTSANDNMVYYFPILNIAAKGTPLTPGGTTYFAPDGYGALVNFETDSPDTVLRLEATRFKILPRLIADGSSGSLGIYIGESTLPDHYITNVFVTTNGSTAKLVSNFDYYHTTNKVLSASQFDGVLKLSKFKHAFLVYYANVSLDTVEDVYGDLEYWTKLEFRQQHQLNELIYMNLFDLK